MLPQRPAGAPTRGKLGAHLLCVSACGTRLRAFGPFDFSPAVAPSAPSRQHTLQGPCCSQGPNTLSLPLQDALESAMKNGLWGHALLLASKMDSRTHARVMTR